MNDARILRDRLASARRSLDSSESDAGQDCNAAMVCQTVQVTTYPTVAAAVYGIVELVVSGNEQEGQVASYVTVTGAAQQFATNLGSVAPPVGTPIIVHSIDGRWVFRFDG